MNAEIGVQLVRHALTAHARLGVRRTVIEGERSIETKAARIPAIDDHVLTIVEVPDPTHEGARKFEVFLSPSEDPNEGEKAAPVELAADFRLFAISVRYDLKPVRTDLLLRQDLPPDAWLD